MSSPNLPTPMTTNGHGVGHANNGDPNLQTAVALLPTPAVNDMGAGKTVQAWDSWTATMQAKHGNGNCHGKSLHIEAARLLPTPKATNNENRQNLDQYGMNLGQALGITALTSAPTHPLSDGGNTSSDDPHPTPPNPATTAPASHPDSSNG